MMKIELEKASNGIIKRVYDNNINGAGEDLEYIKVYDLSDDDNKQFDSTQDLLFEIMEDLSISTGNSYAPSVLRLNTEWGSKYEPDIDTVKTKISELQTEIKILKEYLKNDKV